MSTTNDSSTKKALRPSKWSESLKSSRLSSRNSVLGVCIDTVPGYISLAYQVENCTCIWVFGVAHHEHVIEFWPFKVADPILTIEIWKNTADLVKICIYGFLGSLITGLPSKIPNYTPNLCYMYRNFERIIKSTFTVIINVFKFSSIVLDWSAWIVKI